MNSGRAKPQQLSEMQRGVGPHKLTPCWRCGSFCKQSDMYYRRWAGPGSRSLLCGECAWRECEYNRSIAEAINTFEGAMSSDNRDLENLEISTGEDKKNGK